MKNFFKKPVIAITMGDPGGIGPEVIAKSLPAFLKNKSCYFLLLGTPGPFRHLKKNTHLDIKPNVIGDVHRSSDYRSGRINFYDVSPQDEKFTSGRTSKANGRSSFLAIEAASRGANQGLFDAVVTGPVNKTSVKLWRKGFTGHTEYLAGEAGAGRFAMMFVSKPLKVTLATIHIPIKQVTGILNTGLIYEKIFLTHHFLKKFFKISRPRIAVCALNPHGSETGPEDSRVVAPAIRQARRKGIRASGPHPGDQVFYEALHGRFDAVVSMYHDQGLAPFKLVAFDTGVNVTLGLPYIRTSPDHGTAYNIAYQNKANPASMKAAIDLAVRLVRAAR